MINLEVIVMILGILKPTSVDLSPGKIAEVLLDGPWWSEITREDQASRDKLLEKLLKVSGAKDTDLFKGMALALESADIRGRSGWQVRCNEHVLELLSFNIPEERMRGEMDLYPSLSLKPFKVAISGPPFEPLRQFDHLRMTYGRRKIRPTRAKRGNKNGHS